MNKRLAKSSEMRIGNFVSLHSIQIVLFTGGYGCLWKCEHIPRKHEQDWLQDRRSLSRLPERLSPVQIPKNLSGSPETREINPAAGGEGAAEAKVRSCLALRIGISCHRAPLIGVRPNSRASRVPTEPQTLLSRHRVDHEEKRI
jgi:hypothetical protein